MATYGPLIADFEAGQRVARVPVVVVEASTQVGRNQQPFARFTFRDRSRTIKGIRFDCELAGGEQGAVALLSGRVDDYKGQPQIKVEDLELVSDPEPALLERLASCVDPVLRDGLVETLKAARLDLPAAFWAVFREALGEDPFDLDGGFWVWAAGQSKHHTERGGLAWHVLSMLAHADAVAGCYPNLDVAVLKLAVLCHDLGKLDCYEMGLGGARRLPLDGSVGHTCYSIARVHGAIARVRARGLEFSRADEEHLLHCIASHHGRLEWGAVYEPATPEAAALHALDYLDSHARCSDQQPAPPVREGGVELVADPSSARSKPNGNGRSEPPDQQSLF